MPESTYGKPVSAAPVDVTDDREARPKSWYVARVQMHCEKKVAQRISALGIECFVPTQQVIRQWSDRKKKIDKVVIPLIVFFRCERERLLDVRKLQSVYSLLTAPGEKQPATIPDNQIEQFKFMLGNCDSEISIEAHTIKKGDKVKVVRGKLKGLEGHVCSVEGKSRVFITIDYLGCASVEISPTDLLFIGN